jgi:radical SAM superfamily enzyme YgiQ (UPF0313 family)
MAKPLTMASSGYQMSDASLCGTITGTGLPIGRIPRKKIHCILPSSPWLADSKTNIPLGVLYIAGLLRAQGHEIVVTSMLDKRYEGNIHLPDAVMDADVHMFGFCTPQFGEALELAAYIKDRNPDALLVAGGPHPSYEPKEVKEAGRQDAYHYKGTLATRRDYRAADGRQLFDTVIVMEGEVATLQMLTDWDAGRLQPYYYGDKADAMDLDAIPFPAWDLLPLDHIYNDGVAVMKRKYFPNAAHPEASSAVMSLIGSRGCPYRCTYCFVQGTLIDMADGSQQPIEWLQAGDSVLSFDRSTGLIEPRAVTAIASRQADDVVYLHLEDGTVLGVTADHPFVTPEGWKNAEDCEGSFLRRLRRPASQSITEGLDPVDVLGRMRARSDSTSPSRSNANTGSESAPGGSRAGQSGQSDGGAESGASRSSVGDPAHREVARSAHGADGAWQSDGRSGHARQDDGDGQATVRRRKKGRWTDAASHAVRACTTGIDQAATKAEARYTRSKSDVGADEGQQPNATTGDCGEDGSIPQARLSRRTDQSAVSRSLERARVGIVRLLRAGWLTDCPLWWPAILDWAVSVWQAAQSGYAARVGAPRDTLFIPALAYAGRYGHPVAGLSRQGVGGAQLLGRCAADEREQALGGCPRERISGDWVRVEFVSFVGRGQVYPLSVAGHETFFAHGIATHNCSTPWIGQAPRWRSPHNIIAEMALVMDKGVRHFKLQDDTFSLHRTKLRELATAIQSAFGPDDFACRIHTRVNTMDDHVAESLKMMSTKVTCFGIESGSQRVLDANKKGTTVAQNTAALKKAKEHGFYTIAFLVAGMSGETVETARETMAWLKSVKPYLDSCNLAVGIPYPGSRWWTHPQESGIEIVDFNYDNQWIVGFSDRDEILVRPHGATIEDMFRIKNEMFQFLVAEGWAKAEWDEDVRIRQRQDEAVRSGVLPDAAAASVLTYAGH